MSSCGTISAFMAATIQRVLDQGPMWQYDAVAPTVGLQQAKTDTRNSITAVADELQSMKTTKQSQ